MNRVILGKDRGFWNFNMTDPMTDGIWRYEAEIAQKDDQAERVTAEAQQCLRQIEEELSAVATELAGIVPRKLGEPGLADATMTAARAILGQTDVRTVDGSAGLAGYTVHEIRTVGEATTEHVENSVSGNVGWLVQAGYIDRVEIHPPSQ